MESGDLCINAKYREKLINKITGNQRYFWHGLTYACIDNIIYNWIERDNVSFNEKYRRFLKLVAKNLPNVDDINFLKNGSIDDRCIHWIDHKFDSCITVICAADYINMSIDKYISFVKKFVDINSSFKIHDQPQIKEKLVEVLEAELIYTVSKMLLYLKISYYARTVYKYNILNWIKSSLVDYSKGICTPQNDCPIHEYTEFMDSIIKSAKEIKVLSRNACGPDYKYKIISSFDRKKNFSHMGIHIIALPYARVNNKEVEKTILPTNLISVSGIQLRIDL